jgi:hypothetical protein
MDMFGDPYLSEQNTHVSQDGGDGSAADRRV